MKAILLAGGKGTRLRPLTINTPKPIVPILEHPFLLYQLALLKEFSEIDEVIISLNYQPDRIQEIIDLTGSIDVFSCQFSGAVFHPVCYNYPDKKYKEISESKVLGKFNSVKKIIETVNPSVYIPAAGPPVFLDRKLFHLNFEETNIFPSPFTFKDFLASKVEGVEIHVPVPGTEFVFKNNIEVNHPVDRIEDLFSDEVLNEYQDSMASYLDSRESSCKSYDPEQVFKLLFEELSEKLTDFNLTHEMKVLFSFSLTIL